MTIIHYQFELIFPDNFVSDAVIVLKWFKSTFATGKFRYKIFIFVELVFNEQIAIYEPVFMVTKKIIIFYFAIYY